MPPVADSNKQEKYFYSNSRYFYRRVAVWRWPLTWHGARVVQHWQRLTGMHCFKLLLKTEESRGEPTQKWAITYEGRKWVSFNRKVQQQHRARIFPLATLRDNYRVTIFWFRDKWVCRRCVKAGSGLDNKATRCTALPGAWCRPSPQHYTISILGCSPKSKIVHQNVNKTNECKQ